MKEKRKLYLFDKKEVFLTGRIARKDIVVGESKKIIELVEIESSEPPTFKHWVKMNELFEIIENNNEEQ